MSNYHQFTLGEFSCYVFSDNSRGTSVANLFPAVAEGEVYAAVREMGYEGETIEVGYNVLLVDTGEQKVLIDTGTGQGVLMAGLNGAGFEAADIDMVIITHGDGDHIGGIEQYPNAQIVMPTGAWLLWTTESGRAQMVEQFIKLFREGMDAEKEAAMVERRAAYGRDVLPRLEERVQLVETEVEFLPGFKLVLAPGHRADHTAVEISSGGETLLHIVDSMRHPVQLVQQEWTSYIDSFPEQMIVTNKGLFARAAGANALVFATHLPFPGLGRIVRADGRYGWESGG